MSGCGVGVGGVVRVGVEHEERTGCAKESGHVVQSHVHVLHQLHVLCAHADRHNLVETSEAHDVLVVDFLIDLFGVALHLPWVKEPLRDRTVAACGWLLSDEGFHASSLCGGFECLVALSLDER